MLSYLLISIILFTAEIGYFSIANRFNIIDQPNHRSSHTSITIRGGGIIFFLAVLAWFIGYGFNYTYFMIGLAAITIISFLDDVLTLNNKIRLGVHLTAVLMLFMQWDLFELQWYWLIIAGIFVIATINAYNFMDGINGITGSYSLLTIGTLFYINEFVVPFTSVELLVIVGISLLIFNFFNFRKKAKCFAGDVGSVSISFILIFLIGQLILKTHNFAYILLLLVYGLDTAITVFFRKIRKENIFEAHRSHFYQYLANQLKYGHLLVSLLYFTVQLVINMIVITMLGDSILYTVIFFLLSICFFLWLRFSIEGKNRLLQPQN